MLTLSLEFLKIIDIGEPFFSRPPPDLLPKIVFEPWLVPERGWVVIFNSLLAAAIPPEETFARGLSLRLRWNTWLALEDSSMFLEPSEVKIQALVLVACHGQDFATPSLSWNLISHACRMAQALGIHIHPSRRSTGKEASERALCLFWSLFMLDKSLSLAFGRPPFLAGSLYEHVPVPGLDLLAKFKPHMREAEREKTQDREGDTDVFGALYISQSLKLSKIMGRISEGLQATGGASAVTGTVQELIETCKAELDIWKQETFEVGYNESHKN